MSSLHPALLLSRREKTRLSTLYLAPITTSSAPNGVQPKKGRRQRGAAVAILAITR
jgi:hypothetical protein